MGQPKFMGIRGRNCIITSFDPAGVRATDWDRVMRELHCHYIIAGLEQCPSTGKWHYHLYLEFDRPWAFARIRAYLPFEVNDIQPRYGSVDEVVKYIKKDGEWWEKGERSNQGHRSDLDALYDDARRGLSLSDIVASHPGIYIRYHKGVEKLLDIVQREQDREREREDIECIVYIGKSGTGKSHRCFHDPDYRESGYKFPSQAPGKVFFDGYDGQHTIWFDEFGGTTMPFSLFLRLVDKWDNRVETKGGSVLINNLRKVLISTTTYPGNWWRQCPKYLEDPRQLWRRLSRVYYIPKVTGYYCDPVIIEYPETFDDRLASALDEKAAAEVEQRESERRRREAVELAEQLRTGGLERVVGTGASESRGSPESMGGSEPDRAGTIDDGWINTVD